MARADFWPARVRPSGMKTSRLVRLLHPPVPMLVIWAIDAIREPGTLLEHSAAVLDEWAARLPLQVEPVFVLTPSQLDLALTPDGRLPMGVESRHRAAAERALAQVVD